MTKYNEITSEEFGNIIFWLDRNKLRPDTNNDKINEFCNDSRDLIIRRTIELVEFNEKFNTSIELVRINTWIGDNDFSHAAVISSVEDFNTLTKYIDDRQQEMNDKIEHLKLLKGSK